MKVGVNDHGVQWIKDGTKYHCTYYIGEGIELSKTFDNVKQSFIDKLTFEDLTKDNTQQKNDSYLKQ